MTSTWLKCTKCSNPIPEQLLNLPEPVPCLSCAARLQVEIFPAFFRRIAPGKEGEALLVEDEASCFYHPQKKAAVACQACGRFLCALCDCELHGRHLCPACLQVGQKKGKLKNLENERTLYDNIALALAVYPVVVIFGLYTPITAPMALYISIRYWDSPRSIVRRTQVRFIVAILFATLQIIGWGVLIYSLATKSNSNG